MITGEQSVSINSSVFKLPPLILHPFSDTSGPGKLVDSSRAGLMLQGLIPNNEFTRNDLERKLVDGRFCEIRMLFYVGKDLARWLEQCTEIVGREGRFDPGIQAQSFAALLVEDAPRPVQEKLRRWGVADYRAIFSRALGLNAMFSEAPLKSQLQDGFLKNYYRFADQLFVTYQGMRPFTRITCAQFDFDLYASGEYSRMLEREWEG